MNDTCFLHIRNYFTSVIKWNYHKRKDVSVMASIQKKNGKFYVVYRYETFDGIQKQKWEKCNDYEEAIYKMKKVEDEQKQQIFIAPSGQTIEEFLEIFIELYGTKHWGLSTYNSKVNLLKNYVYPIIGDKKMQEFTTLNVDQYVNKLMKTKCVNYGKKNAPKYVTSRTIIELFKILRCAWNQAVRWEIVKKNVFIGANLPNSKQKIREIWNAEEIQKALDVCDDQLLYLCINLAFSCSMRISELVGLTWDCVFISDADIEKDNARLIVDKQLLRVYKNDLDVLTKDEVFKIFENQVTRQCKTTLILKSLKMNGEARTVWIPRTVAYMLKEWKKKQDEIKNSVLDLYQDNQLVICFEDGRPCDRSNIETRFENLIRKNNLKKVVFHSLRHSSTTYKLKLNHGDIKATQGDTGHRSPEMITKRYAHILDEDRKINATKFDDEFYARADDKLAKQRDEQEVNDLLTMLKEDDELRKQLKNLLSL